MFVTATLHRGGPHTDMFLTGHDREPGHPLARIDILGGLDWRDDRLPAYLLDADKHITGRGYARTGDWTYDAYRDAYIAPIASA